MGLALSSMVSSRSVPNPTGCEQTARTAPSCAVADALPSRSRPLPSPCVPPATSLPLELVVAAQRLH